jgi:membrane associated rhomboid family serine protease
MFPLSDNARANKFPRMTLLLIVVNIFVFILELITPNINSFIASYALIPSKVNFNDLKTFIPFFTAIFLHGGFLHILSNMWFLFIFGDNVETEINSFRILLLFIISGIAGNALQYAISPTSTIPILGASGAIAGILGCYYVLFPKAKVKTLIFLFFFVTIIDINAPIMLAYWFILQIISSAGILSQASIDQGGVAFFAHIAGFMVGIIAGKLVNKYNLATA